MFIMEEAFFIKGGLTMDTEKYSKNTVGAL